MQSSTNPLIFKQQRWYHRKKFIVSLGLAVTVVASLAIGLSLGLNNPQTVSLVAKGTILSERSHTGVYATSAVSCDSLTCSDIGVDMLSRNGTAVDAAVATLLCTGLFVPHSMGIGGGNFMTVYHRVSQRATVFNARERAPGAATEDMYHGNTNISQKGILAVGVPGELMGYWQAHQLYGRLTWKELFQPSVALCREGITVSNALAKALVGQEESIKKDPGLREIFFNEATGHVLQENDTYVNPQLADTLEAVGNLGVQEFYTGNVSKKLLAEIAALGGIITAEDLASYTAPQTEALVVDLNGGLRGFSVPPPGSGAVLAMSMLILDGYNLSESSLADDQSSALTYHRIVEAFKFAYAERTFLGDPLYVNVTELVANMTSPDYADFIRSRVDDNFTHPTAYYGADLPTREDHGTSHVSVLAPNGDAVSVTSTINLHFGAGIRSLSTGVILNDEMDDFSSPNTTNYFGVPASESNYIRPGKRPLSSMSSSVFVDSEGGVVLVAGAAGGTRITTSTCLTAVRYLWLGEQLTPSVGNPRLHDQLYPSDVYYETSFPEGILDGLRSRGHNVTENNTRAVVNAVAVSQDGTVHAVADWRKSGGVSGI